jgi:hypothetical protein
MNRYLQIAALPLLPLFISLAAPCDAKTHESAQSKACWAQAQTQGLVGQKRTAFHAMCVKGSQPPPSSTGAQAKSESARAVVAPTGASPAGRSDQCNAEAARRGLKDSAFQSFRKGCLASAAPVGAIESGLRPTTPTPAKPKLESLTNAPPH